MYMLAGLFFIIPCTDNIVKIDIRIVSFDIPPQEVSLVSDCSQFIYRFHTQK